MAVIRRFEEIYEKMNQRKDEENKLPEHLEGFFQKYPQLRQADILKGMNKEIYSRACEKTFVKDKMLPYRKVYQMTGNALETQNQDLTIEVPDYFVSYSVERSTLKNEETAEYIGIECPSELSDENVLSEMFGLQPHGFACLKDERRALEKAFKEPEKLNHLKGGIIKKDKSGSVVPPMCNFNGNGVSQLRTDEGSLVFGIFEFIQGTIVTSLALLPPRGRFSETSVGDSAEFGSIEEISSIFMNEYVYVDPKDIIWSQEAKILGRFGTINTRIPAGMMVQCNYNGNHSASYVYYSGCNLELIPIGKPSHQESFSLRIIVSNIGNMLRGDTHWGPVPQYHAVQNPIKGLFNQQIVFASKISEAEVFVDPDLDFLEAYIFQYLYRHGPDYTPPEEWQEQCTIEQCTAVCRLLRKDMDDRNPYKRMLMVQPDYAQLRFQGFGGGYKVPIIKPTATGAIFSTLPEGLNFVTPNGSSIDSETLIISLGSKPIKERMGIINMPVPKHDMHPKFRDFLPRYMKVIMKAIMDHPKVRLVYERVQLQERQVPTELGEQWGYISSSPITLLISTSEYLPEIYELNQEVILLSYMLGSFSPDSTMLQISIDKELQIPEIGTYYQFPYKVYTNWYTTCCAGEGNKRIICIGTKEELLFRSHITLDEENFTKLQEKPNVELLDLIWSRLQPSIPSKGSTDIFQLELQRHSAMVKRRMDTKLDTQTVVLRDEHYIDLLSHLRSIEQMLPDEAKPLLDDRTLQDFKVLDRKRCYYRKLRISQLNARKLKDSKMDTAEIKKIMISSMGETYIVNDTQLWRAIFLSGCYTEKPEFYDHLLLRKPIYYTGCDLLSIKPLLKKLTIQDICWRSNAPLSSTACRTPYVKGLIMDPPILGLQRTAIRVLEEFQHQFKELSDLIMQRGKPISGGCYEATLGFRVMEDRRSHSRCYKISIPPDFETEQTLEDYFKLFNIEPEDKNFFALQFVIGDACYQEYPFLEEQESISLFSSKIYRTELYLVYGIAKKTKPKKKSNPRSASYPLKMSEKSGYKDSYFPKAVSFFCASCGGETRNLCSTRDWGRCLNCIQIGILPAYHGRSKIAESSGHWCIQCGSADTFFTSEGWQAGICIGCRFDPTLHYSLIREYAGVHYTEEPLPIRIIKQSRLNGFSFHTPVELESLYSTECQVCLEECEPGPANWNRCKRCRESKIFICRTASESRKKCQTCGLTSAFFCNAHKEYSCITCSDPRCYNGYTFKIGTGLYKVKVSGGGGELEALDIEKLRERFQFSFQAFPPVLEIEPLEDSNPEIPHSEILPLPPIEPPMEWLRRESE